MRYRQDDDLGWAHLVAERERKPRQYEAANVEMSGAVWPALSEQWTLCDHLQRAGDLCGEVVPQAGPLRFIPVARCLQIGEGTGVQPHAHRARQGLRQRVARRSRTTAQSCSTAVPASTSAARRSISASQA